MLRSLLLYFEGERRCRRDRNVIDRRRSFRENTMSGYAPLFPTSWPMRFRRVSVSSSTCRLDDFPPPVGPTSISPCRTTIISYSWITYYAHDRRVAIYHGRIQGSFYYRRWQTNPHANPGINAPCPLPYFLSIYGYQEQPIAQI